MKINYLMATWSGNRDRMPWENHVKRHISQLNRVKHNLAQITIGYPANRKVSKDYDECIRNLTSLDDGTPIVVHHMENRGISYGQYSRLFDIYRDSFSHYILVEDDYVPVIDHFDSALMEMYQGGFLCGVIFDGTGRWGHSNHPRHAAVSNGLISTEELEKVRHQHGCLFPQNLIGGEAQVAFSQNLLEAGVEIHEYVDRYPVMYCAHDRMVVFSVRHTPGAPEIFRPIQTLTAKRWKVEWRFPEWFGTQDGVQFTSQP